MSLSFVLMACGSDINSIREGKVVPERTQLLSSDTSKHYDFDVSLPQRTSTAITLAFYNNGKPQRKDYIFNYENSRENNEKLYQSFVNKQDSKVGNNTFRFRIKITDKSTGKIIADRVISNPYLNASWGGRRGYLTTETLEKGEYLISVDCLQTDKNVNQLYSELMIEKVHVGK